MINWVSRARRNTNICYNFTCNSIGNSRVVGIQLSKGGGAMSVFELLMFALGFAGVSRDDTVINHKK